MSSHTVYLGEAMPPCAPLVKEAPEDFSTHCHTFWAQQLSTHLPRLADDVNGLHGFVVVNAHVLLGVVLGVRDVDEANAAASIVLRPQ